MKKFKLLLLVLTSVLLFSSCEEQEFPIDFEEQEISIDFENTTWVEQKTTLESYQYFPKEFCCKPDTAIHSDNTFTLEYVNGINKSFVSNWFVLDNNRIYINFIDYFENPNLEYSYQISEDVLILTHIESGTEKKYIH